MAKLMKKEMKIMNIEVKIACHIRVGSRWSIGLFSPLILARSGDSEIISPKPATNKGAVIPLAGPIAAIERVLCFPATKTSPTPTNIWPI